MAVSTVVELVACLVVCLVVETVFSTVVKLTAKKEFYWADKLADKMALLMVGLLGEYLVDKRAAVKENEMVELLVTEMGKSLAAW